MRDDFNDDLPDIRATSEDRVGNEPGPRRSPAAEPPLVRAMREPAPRRQRNGALWAVCLSLLIALIGLGYWSHEQQSRLQRQLVATQESFARISEEAAGQLQDISGKVIATESNLSQVEQQRVRRLERLEKTVEQLVISQQEQQQTLAEQQQALQTRQQNLQQLQQATQAQAQRFDSALEELSGALADQQQRQQQALTALTQQLDSASQAQATVGSELAQLQERLQALAPLEQQLAEQSTQLARQRGQIEALLEASTGPSMEQEMLVLRSELELRLAAVEDAVQAIDSFRIQANRNISTLQTQLGNLQQQMSQR